jgi:hypothetical protein
MSGANIKELTQLVGSRVILEVSGNTTFTGILNSVDADSGLVALRDNAMGHQADYNIVNAAHIVKFSSVGAPLSADKVEVLSSRVPAVPEETLQKYYARESQQVHRAIVASHSAYFCISLPRILRSRRHPSTFKGPLGTAFQRKRSSSLI